MTADRPFVASGDHDAVRHKLVLSQVVLSDRMIRQCDFLWRCYFYVDGPDIGVEKTLCSSFLRFDYDAVKYVAFYRNIYYLHFLRVLLANFHKEN